MSTNDWKRWQQMLDSEGGGPAYDAGTEMLAEVKRLQQIEVEAGVLTAEAEGWKSNYETEKAEKDALQKVLDKAQDMIGSLSTERNDLRRRLSEAEAARDSRQRCVERMRDRARAAESREARLPVLWHAWHSEYTEDGAITVEAVSEDEAKVKAQPDLTEDGDLELVSVARVSLEDVTRWHGEIERAEAEQAGMREALKRLASSEAFTIPMHLKGIQGDELKARLDFARAALATKPAGWGWVCDNCGHAEDREREVRCWKCGKGEMAYQCATKPAEFTNVLGQQVPKVDMHEHECCPCGGLRWSACAVCGEALDCAGCADCKPAKQIEHERELPEEEP